MSLLRRSDVTVQELDRETMVYDPITREFHLLNDVAAFVFGSADGRVATQDLLAIAPASLGRPVSTAEIEAAVSELDRVELLDRTVTPIRTVSRRDAVLRLGAVALSAPFITTMLAPSVAMAKSGTGGGGSSDKPKKPKKPSEPKKPREPKKDEKDKKEGVDKAASEKGAAAKAAADKAKAALKNAEKK